MFPIQVETGAKATVDLLYKFPFGTQELEGIAARGKIVGLAPQADSGNPDAPFDPPGLFAANAYDCANLIALAAVRADSDVPRDIARQVAQVSVSGSACDTFAECVETISSGLAIDYNGPSGVTDLLIRSGDPSRATFDRFVFDESGRDVLQRVERDIMLQIVDVQWKDHLYSLDHLKEGIGLRGYGQRDPLVEYKKESFDMFQAMLDRIEDETLRYLFLLQPVAERVERPREAEPPRRQPSRPLIYGQRESAAAPPREAGPPPSQHVKATIPGRRKKK